MKNMENNWTKSMVNRQSSIVNGQFFLLAGPCVIEGEEMALRIAEKVVGITEKLQIPYAFKGK